MFSCCFSCWWVLFFYFWPYLFGGIIPLTGTWRYRQLLSRIRGADYPVDRDVLAIFPQFIPEQARNRRLYFDTPPGDMDLQLRCTLPALDVAALVKRVVAPSALAKAKGQEQTNIWDQQRIPLPAPMLGICEPEWERKLPDSYTMYVTHVGGSPSRDGAVWLYQSGIAVNPQTDDVIYWVESHATGTTNGPSPTTAQ